ncbi:hypothetical protein [Nonomuraea sp. NPDC050643]|uniref:hypothetical protein n=1 Tax=Nonomuraea sp. NPDC050643 TaxID=3155660 RepID=UPI0033D4660A
MPPSRTAGDDARDNSEVQTYGTAYSARVGGSVSGQVVVGDHNVVVHAAEGSSVAVREEGPPTLRRRRRPAIGWAGRSGQAPVGREAELAEIGARLADGVAVQVAGPPGAGKTTVLRRIADDRRRDGEDVLWVSAAGLSAEDVLQELFEAGYDVSGYRPEPRQFRWLMGSIRALVVVDDFEGTADDLGTLLDALPACDVLVASVERSNHGLGRFVALPGLAYEAAAELIARELGRPLDVDEQAAARGLWEAVHGHPLALVQAAAFGLAAAADPERLAPAVATSLGDPERTVLAALRLLRGVPVPVAVLAALTEHAELGEPLAELERVRLIETGSGGVALAGSLGDAVAAHAGARVAVAEMAARTLGWVSGRATLGDVAGAAPALRRLMESAAALGEHDLVRGLARAVTPALHRTLRWGAGREILALGRTSAHAVGAADDEAYFAHEQTAFERALGKGAAVGALAGLAMGAGHYTGTTAATTSVTGASAGAGTGTAATGAGTGTATAGGVSAVVTSPVAIGTLAAVVVAGAVGLVVLRPSPPPVANPRPVAVTSSLRTPTPTPTPTPSPRRESPGPPAGGTVAPPPMTTTLDPPTSAPPSATPSRQRAKPPTRRSTPQRSTTAPPTERRTPKKQTRAPEPRTPEPQTPEPEPAEPVEEPPRLLGPVDFAAYCRSQNHDDARLDGDKAYDWRCTSSGGSVTIPMTSACRHQYGTENAIDRIIDYHRPDSWECWKVTRLLGPVDMDAFCRSQGHDGARRTGDTAYDWRCETADGLASLSVAEACRHQYGVGVAIDRMADFHRPDSWECWA